ncbi:protein-associating with the carboxyl-terminal domain of ezrin-like isoform X2 [Saccostrea echinata]|uniref:protein-associating with the carboxyl-terminal domain of ezrin-like isoform X2 n=1 Tax=Saccostrea echinata TaxID=191078 RepID=UPI002A82F6E7|nr:protein-associating with the carboxyl-terminal domain of ezrin-like isoform X2 [Saccostrea echinata]
MGAETSLFEECELDEPADTLNCTWSLRHGIYNEELDVTVLSEAKNNKQKWSLLQKNIKAKISHNNICQEAIYVTSKGTWKIGELQHCCKFLEITPEFLKNSRPYRNADCISPEEKTNKLTVTIEMGHTMDVFSFGVMCENLLEYLAELGEMTKTFEMLIQDKCLNSDPKQRPKISSLMNDQLFRNDLLLIRKFLSEVTLKSQKEKEEFFSYLYPRLTTLPEEVVGKQLVHLLLSRFVLLDASAASTIVPNILVPKRDTHEKFEMNSQRLSPFFSVPTYQRYVIPELIKMFHCHDYHIRMILLNYLSKYVDLFEKKNLEEIIFPQILLGVRDCHEDLAAQSLHSLADMVKILGRDTVIGGKSKEYFTKGTPKHLPTNALEKENSKNLDKVLLKDLAAYSASDTRTSNISKIADVKRQGRQNKEQKLVREQMRLEQQQKRKERREKEKEMSDKNNEGFVANIADREIMSMSEQEPVSKTYGNQDLKGPFTEIQGMNAGHLPPVNIPEKKLSEENEEGQNISSFDVKVSKSWNDDHVDPDVYVMGNDSEDDWSDWDNNLVDTSPSQLAPVISIESEKKLDKEYWNFSKESSKQDYVLHKETSHRNQQSQPIGRDGSNKNHTSLDKLAKNALKLQSSKKKLPEKENTPLGAEFEIKQLGPSVQVALETDYFADMGLIPVIKQGVSSEEIMKKHKNNSSTSSAAKISTNPLSYNMDENCQLDMEGWEDDLNWTEED